MPCCKRGPLDDWTPPVGYEPVSHKRRRCHQPTAAPPQPAPNHPTAPAPAAATLHLLPPPHLTSPPPNPAYKWGRGDPTENQSFSSSIPSSSEASRLRIGEKQLQPSLSSTADSSGRSGGGGGFYLWRHAATGCSGQAGGCEFRLAYVAPESRVIGAGVLVDQPNKIALNYLRGYFLLDLFVVLPLPQVMLLVVIPNYLGSSVANYSKNLLRGTVLLQYVPRILRFVPLLGGQSASGFIFESPWVNFAINLLMFVLSGHVVGSCWYLFGLQRVNSCLQDACSVSNISGCKAFIDCGHGKNIGRFNAIQAWHDWVNDPNSTDCLNAHGNFRYGVYQQAVLLSTKRSIITRYAYSLCWGFQQISTLAGSLVPSYFEGEVLFTMSIVGLGLLLFALLIGNMQNFLQALGRRRLEMQLRQRDVEQWMSHRRLPEEIRRKVRQAEQFSWTATRGVNEEELIQNLPEDLQREIRHHFFKFLKKSRIFTLPADEPILDAICEKLRQKFYIRGSDIFYHGGPVEKMVFIVRGRLESIGADGNAVPLSEGDVCGEELLTWYLEQSTVQKDGGKIRFPGQRLFSTRTVKCLTNVEAFALTGADLEEVTTLFARFLRHQRVQGAIRYESPYWRNMAATQIQVAWRYRQWCIKRRDGTAYDLAHPILMRYRTARYPKK